MNCHSMLSAVLDGDLDELAGMGESALAGHVRQCGRCRAVARQVLDDTRLLRPVLASEAVERAPIGGARNVTRQALRVAAGLVLGLLAYFTFRGRAQPPHVRTTIAPAASIPRHGTPASITTAPNVPSAIENPPTMREATSGRVLVAGAQARTPSLSSRPYDPALPVRPTMYAVRREGGIDDGMSAPHATEIVSVHPTPGWRAAVMRTVDPSVTVVWLY